MPDDIVRDPDLEWLDHARPTGLVLSPTVIKERMLVPERQTKADTADVASLLAEEDDAPALTDPWAFFETVLGWDACYVAGAPGGPNLPDNLNVAVPEHETTLSPDWAVQGFDADAPWQLLVCLEAAGIALDKRGETEGWEATPHQRFERLLRETGVHVGIIITDRELRFVYAPRGETSGWIAFPLRSLASVAGRPMLSGLKLILGAFRLFNAPSDQRLRALLKQSRDAQAAVSTALAEQVLGSLHELLRGFNAAESFIVGDLATRNPQHLYEGLLTVLMRLVFVLYSEDRDLIPSRTDATALRLYEEGYSVRGLYARLTEDAALNPDTMEERYGGWGRLLALFRLIHKGHPSGFVIGRRGKLFDPDVFPFLEGRADSRDRPRVPKLTDGCLLRLLEGLMTVREPRSRVRQRLSYRTLDVEQIGSVYETVMGFTVELAPGRVLAIRAGTNNKTPVFADLDKLVRRRPADRTKYLKEKCNRGNLPTTVERAVKAAGDADAMAAALDAIVDERASPAKAALGAGTPILQPTEERRRTGSHYTPRALTEPIVRHALKPTLNRLGDNVRPEAILDLKVCDPAMGSGAFLVEACRQLAESLTRAWARWPETRPQMPADEDEELHARRLIAQRCLYGVDRNPMAVDLGRLSLWLATLARDHEFTFLDHALKCGDSLVGLEVKQIEALHWQPENADVQLSLMQGLVRHRLEKVDAERRSIRQAVEIATEEELRPILNRAQAALADPKLIGDAIIAALFSAGRATAREGERVKVRAAIEMGGSGWQERLEPLTAPLRAGEHQITPFHWPVEFPEVFDRRNSGFDAVIGNPPFAGKNTIIASNADHYLDWLKTLHEGAHGNADLVAHFFRRAFHLLREGGSLGLIATKTIRQGDTRERAAADPAGGRHHLSRPAANQVAGRGRCRHQHGPHPQGPGCRAVCAGRARGAEDYCVSVLRGR
jgi:N-6 DNA Methylase